MSQRPQELPEPSMPHGDHGHDDPSVPPPGHSDHDLSLDHSHGPPSDSPHGDGTTVAHVHPAGSDGAVGTGALAHGAGVGKVLHLDCFSGIAGDMLVAALLDLGVPREPIARALEALPVGGYSLGTTTRTLSGIVATRFLVHVDKGQPQRTWKDIRAMLEAAPLLDDVRSRALAAFSVLATAEGRVHRIAPEDVHFHEVGAVDAIVDVVAASAALSWLGARVTSSPLPMGRGFVRAAHGILPLPAPAVVEILVGVPTVEVAVNGELVTPTGAALVRANARSFHRWPAMRPVATGFGAGTRTLPDRPNMLRVVLGDPDGTVAEHTSGTHVVVEANLDDATGQLAGHVTETLLREGALDAWTTPIGMKKGRPGVTLSALARRSDLDRIGRAMLGESTSLGLRWRAVHRIERPRRTVTVTTPWGDVPVKVADGDGLAPQGQPEWDVCRELAARASVPVKVVLAAAQAAWWAAEGTSR